MHAARETGAVDTGCGAACRVRRRCRSEGLEHSPYDHYKNATIYSPEVMSHRGFHNFTTLARMGSDPARDHYVNITSFPHLDALPVPAYHTDITNRQSPNTLKTYKEPNKISRHPSPIIRHEDRLPRVEELFEKFDHNCAELMEFEPKQPLKSILNNPRKSPPPGILKKKSKGQERQAEGRRRQRAMSESEYNNLNHDSTRVVNESRLQNALTYMKRMKDNSGTAYVGSPDRSHKKSASPTRPPAPAHDWTNGELRLQETNVLRTSAIRREELPAARVRPAAPAPASSPPASPSLSASPTIPADSNTSIKKRVRKAKVKGKKMRTKKSDGGDADIEDVSPSMSPGTMDTDCGSPAGTDTAALSQLSDKLTNGAVLTNMTDRVDKVLTEKTQANYSTANLHTTNPFRGRKRAEAMVNIPYELSSCVRPSLFPRVPPYFKFITHDQTPALRPPLAIGKNLRWKLTTITPIVVKKTLLNSGFKLVRSDCDTSECPQEETVEWIGIWGKHMKSLTFRGIKDGQKMNHFPGTFQIGRKDRLWRSLQKLAAKHGLKEFGIMPKTYVLPYDLKLLKRDWEKYATRNEKWIIKPPASARGSGIAVVSRWVEIPKKRSVVVQRYIAKPYLINGSKFDLRLYVLITSMHPIKIYLFSDGLARFASVKYTDDQATLHDRYMHLTNYSINRLSKNYTSNEDATACRGHKWTLTTLMQYLQRERGVDTKLLWDKLKDLVIKTIISGESTIRSLTESNITSRYNCYELFGIDVLLDEDLKPWLLEVNISPSLHSSSPLDLYVKGPLVTAVLNIAQFHLPARGENSSANITKNAAKYAHLLYDPRLYTVYLSKEERDKHIIYSKMELRSEYLSDILATLTPDDVRHLIQAEDELAAGAVLNPVSPPTTASPYMERIFPTADTHKYLEYLAAPRYYNRLLDAWETKYRHDRTQGLSLLRSLCEIGYHQEVPPVPIKSDEEEYPSLSLEVVATPTSNVSINNGDATLGDRDPVAVAVPSRA